MSARSKLIVALDTETSVAAEDLVMRLGDSVDFYKIGWRLVVQSGMALVDDLIDQGKRVFLLSQMDDIDETVSSTVRMIGDRAEFLTIQGGIATAKAAQKGRVGEYPKILQVTLLSSMDGSDINAAFGNGAPSVEHFVLDRAQKSLDAGCDGLIASGGTIQLLRDKFKDRNPRPLIVSPGIRPAECGTDDHKRAMTPREAILAGSDYLVVGRPILQAADQLGMVEKVVEEIAGAMEALAVSR